MQELPDLNNANMSALSLDGRKRMEIDKRLVGHITLPIPDGVTDQNKVDFGGGTMNALQVGGAEVALDFLLRGVGEAGEQQEMYLNKQRLIKMFNKALVDYLQVLVLELMQMNF